MKITKILLSTAVAGMFMVACSGGGQKTEKKTEEVEKEVTGEITKAMTDLENSVVTWTGNMTGLKVYSHFGTVNLSEGYFEKVGDDIVGGKFVIDLTTITPTDENYGEGKTPEMLVGHLSSPDFFDVENHPTASFEVTGFDGENLAGKLTIRGNTHEETITGVNFDKEAHEMTGKLVFDRTKYDVSFAHPVQELILANDIALDILLKPQM